MCFIMRCAWLCKGISFKLYSRIIISRKNVTLSRILIQIMGLPRPCIIF